MRQPYDVFLEYLPLSDMKTPRLALVSSEFFLTRLTPTLASYIRSKVDYRIIDVRHSIDEIKATIAAYDPAVIITEWLPHRTKQIHALGIPTVIVNCETQLEGAVSIIVDDIEVGNEAARFFLKNGYNNFAYYSDATAWARQRRIGFAQTLKAAGKTFFEFGGDIPQPPHYLEYSIEVKDPLMTWINSLPKPIAVFAAHDPLGRHVSEACQLANIRIPEDVAIVGVNNDELVCSLTHPMLSSIEIPWERLGLAVAEIAMALLFSKNVDPGPHLIGPGTVIRRQSTDLVSSQDPLIRRSLGYLQNHFSQNISIESMCSELNVNRRSLERKYTAQLGRTPWEMLCNIRVDTAKSLLNNKNHSIAQIAEMAGFSNAERFSVTFKRFTGRSPSDFRRTMRKR